MDGSQARQQIQSKTLTNTGGAIPLFTMRNILALIGLISIIYYFQLLKYLNPLWGKLRKDSDIQKVEQIVKPVAEKLGSDLGVVTPSPTPSVSPSPKQYGAQLKITVPGATLQSGFGVTPETKKDLGAKDE